MKISKTTIIRTVVLLLAVINMVLRQFGIHPINIEQGDVAAFVELLIEIFAIAASWWYNNSFTENAKRADEYFKELKQGG